MSSHRAINRLLLLIAPVCAVGLYYSMELRSDQIKPRGAHAWYARYAKLKPHLTGVKQVAIVYHPDDPTLGNKRLFQTQYVLAPIVVGLLGKRLPKIRPHKVALIYDFRSEQLLSEVLSETATTARRRGVAVEAVRVGAGLALVRMKRLERE